MKNIKRIVFIILLLLVCVYSFSACSEEQKKDVFETGSNVSLKSEDNNQLFHTQSPLYKEFSLLDGDGNGTPDYLIEQSLMDIFGGHGQYQTVIYGKSDTDKYDNVC